MKVAARIKQIRENQTGLSRKEIAQLVGISAQEYDDIENGNIDITLTRFGDACDEPPVVTGLFGF
ncbi:DNA-binding XRE family transcriptional regulator [Algoriphagus sp. 4150]|uniref:helix-turn-helix domain-containing protein n=1 Tax=Algoriphagus sp. 4150 TaxID=2817756 RepID=UPI00285CDE2B|nr:helix-turn-helix transcriptional regulator [Algoriphagus sp. 4150]MDR7130014.1 DNA-binding XRE family transcriptional regulator [Algoriphagus sp. 4150]